MRYMLAKLGLEMTYQTQCKKVLLKLQKVLPMVHQ